MTLGGFDDGIRTFALVVELHALGDLCRHELGGHMLVGIGLTLPLPTGRRVGEDRRSAGPHLRTSPAPPTA